MKSMAPASTPTVAGPGRGAGQSTRAASAGRHGDADTFGAVLQGVRPAPEVSPGPTTNARGAAANAAPRDAALRDASAVVSTGTDAPQSGERPDPGASAARDAPASDASAAGSAAALAPAPNFVIGMPPAAGTHPTAEPQTAAPAGAQFPGVRPGPAPATLPQMTLPPMTLPLAALPSTALPLTGDAATAAPGTAVAGPLAASATEPLPGPPSSMAATAATVTSPTTPTTSAPATAPPAAGAGSGPTDTALAAAALADGAATAPDGSTSVAPGVPTQTPAADVLAAAGSAAAVAAPAAQPASSAAPAPHTAPPPQPQTGPALQTQVAKPLFTLAGAPQGQHIMTLQVSPDNLGPLTVRALIDAAGVRIELFAPGDAGREAIRGILPELRKELADAGFGASLDVSAQNGPGSAARDGTGRDPADQGTGRDPGPDPGGSNGRGDQRPGHRWDALADGAALRHTRAVNGPQTTLDILV
ncbi:flagellar hook-length control protein FliK [Arthrobacter sp. MP_M7]|nr:flagellar hook-length control protein FliK [Arthrobacter sp. MP_M4]MEC5204470.1 flagellar hook-length control protein FliK [Arthrobacter sp. MP_M7]